MLISVIAGIAVGLLLGALGGGGAILTLPVLVLALGLEPHVAASSSLVIVGVTSAIALISAARRRVVRWGTGVTFGIIGTAGIFVGTAVARQVGGSHLLVAFSALLLVVAVLMWRRAQPRPTPQDKSRKAAQPQPQANRAASIMAAATGVGLLTGFFGVGGGFAIVPTLVLALGFAMPEAVGTSLLVLTLNTTSALVARAIAEHGLPIDVGVVLPFTLAAVAGSLAGARLGTRVAPHLLQRSFAVLLVAVAILTAVRTLA